MEHNYKAIIIGGSAGSFQVVSKIISEIRTDFRLPIIMALHRLKHVKHGFVETLALKSKLPISEPFDKEPIKGGHIYLAPANYHLLVELASTFSLSTNSPVNHSRPGIDITFMTAAYAYKEKAVGIILSGANKDGAFGLKRIKDQNGLTIIQDPQQAQVPTMPKAAMDRTNIDHVFSVEQIIKFLNNL